MLRRFEEGLGPTLADQGAKTTENDPQDGAQIDPKTIKHRHQHRHKQRCQNQEGGTISGPRTLGRGHWTIKNMCFLIILPRRTKTAIVAWMFEPGHKLSNCSDDCLKCCRVWRSRVSTGAHRLRERYCVVVCTCLESGYRRIQRFVSSSFF